MGLSDNAALRDRDRRTWPRTAVFSSDSCSGPWTAVPYLQVVSITECAGPGVNRCELRYDSGAIKREDAEAFAVFEPLALVGKYVRVELYHYNATQGQIDAIADGTLTALRYAWRFVVTADSLEPHVQLRSSSGDRPDRRGYARQTITAFGLAHLLDRVPVQGAYVLDPTGTRAIHIDTPLEFNAGVQVGVGLDLADNRSDSKRPLDSSGTGGAAYAFTWPGGGRRWTIANVVEYLLTFYARGLCATFAMTGADDSSSDGGIVTALRDTKAPRLSAEGRTVLEVINELVSFRRGFGWRERQELARDAATVTMEAFTVVDAPITAGDVTIPANVEQGSFTLADRHDVQSVEVTDDDSQRYGTIKVIGEAMRSVFSLSAADGTLVPVWSDQQAAEYKLGANLDGVDNAAKNDAVRANQTLARVFSAFTAGETFDWLVRDGLGIADQKIANPLLDDDGVVKPTEQGPFRSAGFTYLRQLPLIRVSGTLSAPPEYSDPACFVQLPSGRWLDATRPADRELVDGANEFRMQWPHLRMDDTWPVVWVHFQTQHFLAGEEWTEAPVAKPSTHEPPILRWSRMILTVAAECDQRLKIVRTVAGNDASRTKLIYVPGARFDWIVDGAVVGIKDDGTPMTWLDRYTRDLAEHGERGSGNATTRGTLKDDSGMLRQVAGLAQAWYGVKRGILRIVLRMIDVPIYDTDSGGTRTLTDGTPVGGFVTAVADELGSRPVNCVVTSKQYDFAGLRTTIMTNFEELDFSGVLGVG